MSTSDNDEKMIGQIFYETLDAWGGTAFPVGRSFDDGSFVSFAGLTIRDWFAGMALSGHCGDGIPGSHHLPENAAREAYAIADAMLAERNKARGEQP